MFKSVFTNKHLGRSAHVYCLFQRFYTPFGDISENLRKENMATTADLPIITAPSDPAVLANSESTPPSMDSPNTSPAGSAPKAKTKAKTPEEEELERQIEALAVPGFSLHQEGVFTVVRKVQKTGRSRTFPARLAR